MSAEEAARTTLALPVVGSRTEQWFHTVSFVTGESPAPEGQAGRVLFSRFRGTVSEAERISLAGERGGVVPEEERRLGGDQVHLLVDDETRSCFGGIERLEVSRHAVRMRLSARAAEALRTERALEILFDLTEAEREALVAGLTGVFGRGSAILAVVPE